MPKKTPDTVTQVALRAASILETNGWVQGQLGTHSTGYCLLGAINETGAPFNLKTQVKDLLNKTLNARARSGLGQGFVAWNDDRRRTKKQVINLLHLVAKKADQRTE